MEIGANPKPPPLPARQQTAPTSTLSLPGPKASPGTKLPPINNATKRFGFKKPEKALAHRTTLYGSGGIGKTSLAMYAPAPVIVFDLDNSVPVLLPTLKGLDVRVVGGVEVWSDLRSALGDTELFAGIKTVVLDSMSIVEAMAVGHTLKTVPHEKGNKVTRLEDFGYGKGYQHVFETFMPLLVDLDKHIKAGRNVVLICHECTATVPNPAGEDFIRYEPRLQSPSSGKASIRLALKEWTDHLLFIGYDVAANRDGKAVGGGTRTLYPCEQAHFMAKSRTLKDPIPYCEGGREIWKQLFGG